MQPTDRVHQFSTASEELHPSASFGQEPTTPNPTPSCIQTSRASVIASSRLLCTVLLPQSPAIRLARAAASDKITPTCIHSSCLPLLLCAFTLDLKRARHNVDEDSHLRSVFGGTHHCDFWLSERGTSVVIDGSEQHAARHQTR